MEFHALMLVLRCSCRRLDRDLITSLYHAARVRRVTITKLASTLVREGLARHSADSELAGPIIWPEPPADDPGERK